MSRNYSLIRCIPCSACATRGLNRVFRRQLTVSTKRAVVQANGKGMAPNSSLLPHRLTWPRHGSIEHRLLAVKTKEDASRLVEHLDANGRQLLMEQLRLAYSGKGSAADGDMPDANKVTGAQLYRIFLFNGLPFIGFGILDNGIMILAGEYIDITIGVTLGISTMAAAALGNLVSDVAGVGSAGYVELLVAKFGVRPIELTTAQTMSNSVRWTIAFGRAIGLSIGCIIGMFPLLFFDRVDKEDETKASETNTKQLTSQTDHQTIVSS